MRFLPPGETATLQKLRGFRYLPAGWHYGQGAALSTDVVGEAELIYNHLLFLGFTRTDAFAGAGGEAQLAAYHREHHISVTIEPNLSLCLEHEVNGEDVLYEGNLQLSDVKAKLREVAEAIWSTSDSSTHRISTRSRDISEILNSREDHPMDLACRWSSWSVPPRRAAG